MSVLRAIAAHLTPEELQAVQRFTLAWTIFEARALDNSASFTKIQEVVNERIAVDDWFRDHINYFSQRYISDGSTNHHFASLNFRKNDGKELVQRVLLGQSNESSDRLIACLAIIYRFRNNLFHGLKWEYELNDQLENFEHAADLLDETLCRLEE